MEIVPPSDMDNATIANVDVSITELIKTVRGEQVILDRDLAELYGVETKQLNRQVKRNIVRFPQDFMFQLTKEEYYASWCHFGTLNTKGKNIKYLPYVFTENGVAMLSGLLRTETAIDVNIRIMRAFNAMRHFVASNIQIFNRIANIEQTQTGMLQHQKEMDKRIDLVFEQLTPRSLPQEGVFYDGQIYDAYAFVADLVRSAKERIILIDNYIDDRVLTLLDKRNPIVSATIYTKAIDAHLKLDIDKHNAQYAPICVKVFSQSHDRFLCIDNVVYHIGASLKDLGKRWFAFSKMECLHTTDLLDKI